MPVIQSSSWSGDGSNLPGSEFLTFAVCGLGSGAAAAIVSAPADLVKTRVMGRVDPSRNKTIKGRQCGISGREIFTQTTALEGARALWKGTLASFLRLGPHFTIAWPLLEFVRTRIFGLGYF